MQLATKGLVLREVKTGEADRILSILTPDHGIISAAAKGSMRPKSKLFSATGLFCYSEWTLFEGRTMYRVNEASPIEVFFGLREDVEAVSVATYLAEMLQILSPTGQEAEELLGLALNSFFVLAAKKQPPEIVKAVFELRALYESGFMPDVTACEACGTEEAEAFRLDAKHGSMLCRDCTVQRGKEPNLDPAALAALRHVVLAEPKKIFNFTLKGNSLALLRRAAEEMMLYNLDYPPKSLSFLQTVLP